jgi:hypothetical protein
MPVSQYQFGGTNPTIATVATAKAVAVGDIVGMSSGTLVKASDETWDTNLATTQTNFVTKFLGVSGQQKDANVARVFGNASDNVIRIDAGGVFEFDCASATFEVGDLVGCAKQSGNALEDQKVVAVASEALAIGRVTQRGTSITRVKIQILSKLNPLARQS